MLLIEIEALMSQIKLSPEQLDNAYYACTAFFSRKWQLSILLYLFDGPKHFGELLKYHDGMSKKMLSLNLHKLESKGVIQQREYMGGNVRRVEYSLTEQGKELEPILELLIQYGIKYYPNNK